jgi:hypothetical protein
VVGDTAITYGSPVSDDFYISVAQGNSVGTAFQEWLAKNPYRAGPTIIGDPTLHVYEERRREHSVAVADVTPSKTIAGQGYIVHINVTVQNLGTFTENFSVTAYASTMIIGSQTVNLENGTSATITFTWSTTNIAYDYYQISATADTLLFETNTSDNTLADGEVKVTIPGDVNDDETVNVLDKLALRHAWGSSPGDPDWNPNCDINSDNAINILDEMILKSNWGRTIQRIHDIAVINTTCKTVAGVGYPLNVDVTTENQGNYTETFNLTVYANSTVIGTQMITLEKPQFVNTTTIVYTTIICNTTNLAYGYYSISATATPVPYETDTADNTLINGIVFATIPGDVNGDGTVDIFDKLTLNAAWGSSPGDPNWNPNCDINSDNAINFFDDMIMKNNWGRTI